MQSAFAAAVADAPRPLVLAVSGGGDSLALMHLAARHAAQTGAPAPLVLTVDHGLRKGSGGDARKVVAWAAALGLTAHVLVWRGKKPASGVEAAARQARYRLMGSFLATHGHTCLCLAHTRDDQAETFLLRLARGSGVDGLSAMAARAPWPVPGFPGLTLARPLLTRSGAELRVLLTAAGQAWLEDPMNQDMAFDRVRMRGLAATLAGAGLSAERIAAAAAHLARARVALEQVTDAVLARAVRPADRKGGLLVDGAALTAAPREVGLRALAAVLMAVSGAPYRPRFEALERLFDTITGGTLGRGATLAGCRIGPADKTLRGAAKDGNLLLVCREALRAGSRTQARGGSTSTAEDAD